MKKIIVLLIGIVFCAGCYIPYPSIGRRTLQPYEKWEKVCTVKVNKEGEKTTKCQWVRSR
jgi:preprotein translocase subunit SecY